MKAKTSFTGLFLLTITLIQRIHTAPYNSDTQDDYELTPYKETRSGRQAYESDQSQGSNESIIRLQLLSAILSSQMSSSYSSPQTNCNPCRQGEVILRLPLNTPNPNSYSKHLLQNPELLCLIQHLIELCGGNSEYFNTIITHHANSGGLLGGLGGLLGGSNGGGLLGGLGGLLGGGGYSGQGGLLGGLGGLLGGSGNQGGVLGGLGGLLGGQGGYNSGGLLGGLGGLLGGQGGYQNQGGLLGGLGGLLGGSGNQGGLLGGVGGLLGGNGGKGYGGNGGLLPGLGGLLGGQGGTLGGVGELLGGGGGGGQGKQGTIQVNNNYVNEQYDDYSDEDMVGSSEGGGLLGGVLGGGGKGGLLGGVLGGGGGGNGLLGGVLGGGGGGGGLLGGVMGGNGLIGGVVNNVGGGLVNSAVGGVLNGAVGGVVGGLGGSLGLKRQVSEEMSREYEESFPNQEQTFDDNDVVQNYSKRQAQKNPTTYKPPTRTNPNYMTERPTQDRQTEPKPSYITNNQVGYVSNSQQKNNQIKKETSGQVKEAVKEEEGQKRKVYKRRKVVRVDGDVETQVQKTDDCNVKPAASQSTSGSSPLNKRAMDKFYNQIQRTKPDYEQLNGFYMPPLGFDY